mmetsp:Transcript_105441/g.214975  ORF Transcript_105441/g.214975 Transcript_105441/m.214975 type:complete len:209 (-) Transcript_105441:400-1026(-)
MSPAPLIQGLSSIWSNRMSKDVRLLNKQGSRPAFSSLSSFRARILASSSLRCFSARRRAALCAGSSLASSSSCCRFRRSSAVEASPSPPLPSVLFPLSSPPVASPSPFPFLSFLESLPCDCCGCRAHCRFGWTSNWGRWIPLRMSPIFDPLRTISMDRPATLVVVILVLLLLLLSEEGSSSFPWGFCSDRICSLSAIKSSSLSDPSET